MYENMDYEAILERMRGRVDGNIGKGEGTLVGFALAPAAAELEEVYNSLEALNLNSSALTCDRERLIMFGVENNIPIRKATNALWIAEFNTDFEIGERFEAGDLTYISTARISDGRYYLKCETAGTVGNKKPEAELLSIEFIDGYEKGELTELAEPAIDDEDTESYRERYLSQRKQEYAMSGNRADYRKFIEGLTGVGGIKLERVKEGSRRIKIYIISSAWGKPSEDAIAAIQQAVDPKDSQGDGEGKAPFFHIVDIYPVDVAEIDIRAKFELFAGVSFASVLPEIEAAVTDYFTGLNKTWEDTKKNGLVVRALKVAEAMAGVEGVVDVRELLLNGTGDNLTLNRNEIAVRGVIENVT